MEIIKADFEQPFRLNINGHTVEVFCFKTQEEGNIKFGVNAPRAVSVNREEIYQAKKNQS